MSYGRPGAIEPGAAKPAAGYGDHSVLWEDSSGKWARVSDLSASGIAAEAGLQLGLGRFLVSVGVSSIALKDIGVSVGAGINF